MDRIEKTHSVEIKFKWIKMCQCDPQLGPYWGTICTPLELLAIDGKKCLNQDTQNKEMNRMFTYS